jgi:hypothetical protein
LTVKNTSAGSPGLEGARAQAFVIVNFAATGFGFEPNTTIIAVAITPAITIANTAILNFCMAGIRKIGSIVAYTYDVGENPDQAQGFPVGMTNWDTSRLPIGVRAGLMRWGPGRGNHSRNFGGTKCRSSA